MIVNPLFCNLSRKKKGWKSQKGQLSANEWRWSVLWTYRGFYDANLASLVADEPDQGKGGGDLLNWAFGILQGRLGRKLEEKARWAQGLWTPRKTHIAIFKYKRRRAHPELPIPDLAVIQSNDSIQKDKQSNEGSWEEHAGVPAQPGKIQPNLLSKVPPV